MNSDDLKENKGVLKFMAKYRYQYHKEMKQELVELIANIANHEANMMVRHELEMVLYGAARMKGLGGKAKMYEISSTDIGDYIAERIERLEK